MGMTGHLTDREYAPIDSAVRVPQGSDHHSGIVDAVSLVSVLRDCTSLERLHMGSTTSAVHIRHFEGWENDIVIC